MKKVYLVRHGESEGNVGPLRQGSSTPLTREGERQAVFVAQRFENIPIDKIISSPQTRAKCTAQAINVVLKGTIEYSDLLIERKRPSFIIGKPKKDQAVIEAEDQIKNNFHLPRWHHSDEENFEDLKSRAIQLIKYIESLKEENILLVTHGIFMRMVVAYVLFGEDLSSQEYWKLFIGLVSSNTGITILEQMQFENEDPRWHLITWNDYAHLGEIK